MGSGIRWGDGLATGERLGDCAVDLNANYVGGDVVTGSNDARQLVFRPRAALDPYTTGIPGVYLCSAATPPGAGAHGMCGYNAATSALRRLESGDRTVPAVGAMIGA
jgi:phytoene dehydrogenase-like protein